MGLRTLGWTTGAVVNEINSKVNGGKQSEVAIIEAFTLSLKRNGIRTSVLRGIDLTIARKHIVALVGESGSGKSLLAMSLMGLLPKASQPEVSGTVRVCGVDMLHGRAADLRKVRRDELGVIFQDPQTSLNPTMRVGAQVTEATHDRETSLRLMSQVGISDAETRFSVYPHQLSGGLRQRVMAAMALGGSPSLIIADEPTTALDVTVQAQLLRLLTDLRDTYECSLLFITHDLAVAAQIADRVAVLYRGRVVEVGSVEEVLTNPTHPYTVGLLRSRLSLRTERDGILPTLRAESESAERVPAGCAYHTRCPLAVPRCTTEQPPLALLPQAEALDSRPTPLDDSGRRRACWRSVEDVQAFDFGQVVEGISGGEISIVGPARADGSQPAVQIDDLHVTFRLKVGPRSRGEIHALRGVSLSVLSGESVAIVGESGSGKSTLLRVIAGLTPPTSGQLKVGAGGAQMIFQDAGSSLTPWIKVGTLLMERLRPLKLSRVKAQQRIDEALTSIGLPLSVADARPGELSGGQRQRVALARATIIPLAVLLCDEPTSSVDASLAASVLNLIREMRSRLAMTVLFVTHDLAVARLMGDRILVMKDGEIVESGDHHAVIEHPGHPYTQRLLASVPEIASEPR